MRPAQPAWLLAAAIVLVGMTASGPTLFDSGELAQAAWELGGSHPPGQPGHALLAHAFARLLPIGPIPFRMALLSVAGALFAAFAAARLAGSLLELLDVPVSALARLAPHAAAAATLLAPAVLRQATRIEVYTPALALALLASNAAIDVARGTSRAAPRAALLGGLAATLHPPTALGAVLIGVVVAAFRVRPIDVPHGLRIARNVVLAFVAGISLYAYLPIRALRGAPMWGTPERLDGFFAYLSARAYASNLGRTDVESAGLFERIGDVTTYVFGFLAVVPLAGFLALAFRLRRRPSARDATVLAFACMVASLVPALLQPLETRTPDFVAYAGMATAWAATLGAAGLATPIQRARRTLAAMAMLVLSLSPLTWPRIREWAMADLPVLETASDAILDTPPPRALLVVETDFVAASAMMARSIDGARPDVAIFATGLSTSSWHWRSLAGHPLYDGRPIRAETPDANQPFVRGAIARALFHVAVVAEPFGLIAPNESFAGPLEIVGPAPRGNAILASTAAERVRPSIVTAPGAQPLGDADGAGAVLRRFELDRARRLGAHGLFQEGLTGLAEAMPWLDEEERERLRAPCPDPKRPAVIVLDESAFLASRGDLERIAAVLLDGCDDPTSALALLTSQLSRGDARSLLQLARIGVRRGDVEGATRALAELDRRAPELREASDRLRREITAP